MCSTGQMRARLIVLGFLTSSAIAAVTASAQGPEVLTLARAVGEAMVRSDQMLNELDNQEQAALGLRLARSTFRPKVVPNIQGSLGQTDISNQTYRLDVSQRFATGAEVRAGFGSSTAQIPAPSALPGQEDLHFYNADTTLTFSQPLLRGFGPSVARGTPSGCRA